MMKMQGCRILWILFYKGWEEVVNASITNLLRTTLSKNSKDQQAGQQSLKMPTDILKLEKHIKALCEKLEKGVVLVPGTNRKPGIYSYFTLLFLEVLLKITIL